MVDAMATKPKPQTLEQRVKQAVDRKQFWFDDFRHEPEQHIHCSFCQETLLIDYFQFGVPEMNGRLMAWVNKHSGCVPGLATKTKDMMLTPKEKRVS